MRPMESQSAAAPFTANARRLRALRLAGIACVALAAAPAHAYVGPGAGLSAIGIVVGLLAAIFFGIVGFVWYPIKRLLRLRRERSGEPQPDAATNEPPAKE